GLRPGAAPALGELHEAEHRRGHTAERGAGERGGHPQVALEAHTGGGRGGGEGPDPSAAPSPDAGDAEILHRGGARHGPHRAQPGDRRGGEGSQGIGVAMHASTVPGGVPAPRRLGPWRRAVDRTSVPLWPSWGPTATRCCAATRERSPPARMPATS